MGDALPAEDGHLLPDLLEEVVVVLRDRIDRRALDGVVGQQHPVGTHGRDVADPRGADARVAGLQRHQSFVLHGPSQRRERALVTDVLQAEEAVDAEQQVGVPLVATQRLDEERAAIGGRREPGRRAPRVDRGRHQPGHRQPAAGQRLGHLVGGGPMVGSAEDQGRSGADEPADAPRDHDVEGHVGAGEQPEGRDEGHRQPQRVAPPPADEQPHDGRAGRGGGDVRRAGEGGTEQPGAGLDPRDLEGRVLVLDRVVDEGDGDRADGPGRGQHEQGPALAEGEQPDHDEHGQQYRSELAEADEEALDAVREAREQPEDGDVEVEDRLLGRDPERQGDEDDQRGDEQAGDEDGRALVLRALRLDDDRRRRVDERRCAHRAPRGLDRT